MTRHERNRDPNDDDPATRDHRATDPFTKFPNHELEAMIKNPAFNSAARVFFVILRYTHGFHKKWAEIPISMFERETGLYREAICNAIANLVAQNVVSINRNGKPFKYRINPEVHRWKMESKKPVRQTGTTKKRNRHVSINRNATVPENRNVARFDKPERSTSVGKKSGKEMLKERKNISPSNSKNVEKSKKNAAIQIPPRSETDGKTPENLVREYGAEIATLIYARDTGLDATKFIQQIKMDMEK